MWGALLNGGRLAFPRSARPRLDELGAELRAHGVTTLWLTAGLFHLMVDERLEDLRPLRQLLAGGDVLCPRRVRQVLQTLPHLRLVNGYGPTENTTFTTCHTVRLEAGGAYLPLDPGYPAERVAFMLEDAAAPVVITTAALARRLPAGRHRVVLVEDPEAGLDATPDAPPPAAATPDSLAYVIYTSGSTGAPKGVAVTHRAVVRLVRGADYVAFGPDQTHLLLAPVSFDASTFELWGALLNGARLAIAPPGRVGLDEIGRAVRRLGVTTLWLTAGLFQTIVDERLDDLGPLRQLVTGGDVVSPAHARRVLERHPHLRLVNGYGPTECATFACCHTVSARTSPRARPCRSAARSPTRAPTSWTGGGASCPSVTRASCGSAATASRAATWRGRSSPRSASSTTRSPRTGASIARATSRAGARTAGWSSSGASTGR